MYVTTGNAEQRGRKLPVKRRTRLQARAASKKKNEEVNMDEKNLYSQQR